MDTNKIKTEVATELKADTADASAKWGLFRKWLAAHPLTGFWGAMILGAAVGYLIGIA